MRRCSCLSAPSFEVDNGNNLQRLARLSMRYVFLCVRAAIFIEILSYLAHLFSAIEAAPATYDKGFWPLAFEVQAFQVVGTDAKVVRGFCHREAPERLLSVRRKFLEAQLIKPARNFGALLKNFLVEFKRESGEHGRTSGLRK